MKPYGFGNKPWADLNKEDIKRVFDDLEDGRIKNRNGLPFEDRSSYYNKVFKSKPFRLAGKSELAKDVIEFSTQQREEVRFTTKEDFTLLVSVLSQPRHLLLFWLAWDIGENIGALLQLTKAEFQRQISRVTNDPEYLVNLTKRKIVTLQPCATGIPEQTPNCAIWRRVLSLSAWARTPHLLRSFAPSSTRSCAVP